MPSLSRSKSFRLLAVNQWRTSVRRFRTEQSWFVRLVMAVVLLYAAFTLFVLGMYFHRFSGELFPRAAPVDVVNRYLLAAFVSLFFIRFLFQKTPRLRVRPYLHLPFDRRRLVGFFQTTSLLSVHNYYPLLFFVPFWLRYVWGADPSLGAALWLVGVILLILGSHFVNLFLRATLENWTGLFYGLMGAFATIAFVDETMGAGIQQELSAHIFRQILRSDAVSLSLLSAWMLMSVAASTLALARSLQHPPESKSVERQARKGIFIPKSWGLTGELIRLELLLMWRNRRPRHYLIVSLMFSTLYLLFMLGSKNMFSGYAFGALIGLFASGGFIMNYGQFMFGWDSSYYSALVTRNIPYHTLVKAKLLILQGSSVALFLLSLPLFLWLRPEYTGLHFAFLFYNAGITSVLVMELAVRNREALDIGRSGGFFNYEGFSAKHWLWFIPTALPPVLLMAALSNRPAAALLILATIGFVSVLCTDLWTRHFGAALRYRKHRMLSGFRNNV